MLADLFRPLEPYRAEQRAGGLAGGARSCSSGRNAGGVNVPDAPLGGELYPPDALDLAAEELDT
ncbi:MAG: hypothetical protein DYG91_02820 [Chloroflexi bacterium CFX7]|nr:hypothetical protein [Chloroflexi bacterium CFX7]